MTSEGRADLSLDQLELDVESRSRLKALLERQTAVTAGQIVLVGLSKIKEAMGDGWGRYRDRVYGQTEKILSTMLDPREVFLRLGEDRYVIVFHEREPAAAQVLCEKIVGTVYQTFLGISDFQGLSVEGVIMMLDPEMVAHSLGLSLERPEPATPLEAASVELSVDPPIALRRAESSEEFEGDIGYMPVWDLPNKIIYTYKPTLTVRLGSRRVSGYLALGDGKDAKPIRILDRQLLVAAIRELIAQQDDLRSAFAMLVPVSFMSLSAKSVANEYFAQCSALPEKLRRQVLFEVAHLTPGAPPSRTFEVIAILRRFARLIYVRVDYRWKDFALLKKLPIQGVTVDLEGDPRPLAQITADLVRIATFVREQGLSLAISGVDKRALLSLTASVGARYAYGHYLISTISRPMASMTLDWVELDNYSPIEID